MGDQGAILMIYSICFISNSSSWRRSVSTDCIDWSTWFPQYSSTWFPILYLKEEHLSQLLKLAGHLMKFSKLWRGSGNTFVLITRNWNLILINLDALVLSYDFHNNLMKHTENFPSLTDEIESWGAEAMCSE